VLNECVREATLKSSYKGSLTVYTRLSFSLVLHRRIIRETVYHNVNRLREKESLIDVVVKCHSYLPLKKKKEKQ